MIALRGAVFAALLVCVLASCSEEPLTQIVVVIDSDWNGFERVELEIQGFGSKRRVNAEDLRNGRPLPRRVALVHDGGELGPLRLTVRAYVEGRDGPQLVEPRKGIFFERGRTRMLKIDLRFACLNHCEEGEACLGDDGSCVESDDPRVIQLTDWDGNPDQLDLTYTIEAGDTLDEGGQPDPATDSGLFPTEPDAAPPAAGSGPVSAGSGGEDEPQAGGGAGTDEAPDAEVDSGPPEPTPVFPYEPANFDPESETIAALSRGPIELDCGESTFDSTTRTFDNFCGVEPQVEVVHQSDDSEVAVLIMDTLRIAPDSTLRLRGDLPVVIAVFGDALITGTIDASAVGATPGPGANRGCETGEGGAGGDDSTGDQGGAGGGGGGYGSTGAQGGTGRDSLGTMTVAGGAGDRNGDAALSPLRGGCSGGSGGAGPNSSSGALGGGGGGAVQISAAGRLDIDGRVFAVGGGGQVGDHDQDGGGGGGSGGAILLEGADIDIDSLAVIAVNGGGGAAGQSAGFGSESNEPGLDGQPGLEPAAGGESMNFGGDGGSGACVAAEAAAGSDSSYAYAGGGGGGGGVGRTRINRASSCAMLGVFSPAASIECPSCGGVCSAPPAMGCMPVDRAEQTRFVCPLGRTWDEAAAICADAGLRLITIADEEENDWLTEQVSDEAWIGATDSATEGQWFWQGADTAFWSGNQFGSPVGGAYENWQNAEPNNGSDVRADCAVTTEDGTWIDRSCTAVRPYVCEPL